METKREEWRKKIQSTEEENNEFDEIFNLLILAKNEIKREYYFAAILKIESAEKLLRKVEDEQLATST